MKAWRKKPFYAAAEAAEEIGSETKPNSWQQQLKADCLARDGFKCVLSGLYDINEAMRAFSAEQYMEMETVANEVAHILPSSLASFQAYQINSF